MPSITYIEDSRSEFDDQNDAKQAVRSESPEPPIRYTNDHEPPREPEDTQPQFNRPSEFDSVRRLVTLSQILAIVSLVIGGVVLSTVAIVIAIIAYRKAIENAILPGEYQVPWKLLKRSATIAIIVAALALCANLTALIVIYPIVLQAIQTGDYSALIPMSSQLDASGNGSNTSTWG